MRSFVVSLRCDADVMAAARAEEAELPIGQRNGPLLLNDRLPFESHGNELLGSFRCAHAT